ncbi:MAG: hypothetical protein OXI51_01995 [Chloroflexota bacterium]|nr:hypothetical protein [Chloroflexota bacterium]MXY37273.1 hypothetical protein [Dehalococcoidia bacterium]
MPEADPYDEYDDFDDQAEDVVFGPDERDRDLLDGSWERQYYAGGHRGRDWKTIGIGVALLFLMGLLLPPLLRVLW